MCLVPAAAPNIALHQAGICLPGTTSPLSMIEAAAMRTLFTVAGPFVRTPMLSKELVLVHSSFETALVR
jgi:hypothetical protein